MNLDDILQQLILVDGDRYTKKKLYDEVLFAVKEHTVPRKRLLLYDDDDEPQQQHHMMRGKKKASGCKGCLVWYECCCCIPIFCLANACTRGLIKVVLFCCGVLCFVAFMVFLSRKAVS